MIKLLKIIWKPFKLLLNIITLRVLRKYIKRKIEWAKLNEFESNLTGKIVYIFQQQFYDIDGKKCYNGGAERYVVDLADILKNAGYNPILIQMGNPKIGWWKRQAGNLTIYGCPIIKYKEFTSCFKKYEFVIYSGARYWSKKIHPNILISHGITWDKHKKNVDIYEIKNIFNDVDNFVSVDINTISWLRSTFSKSFHNKKMNYIPNYVDTSIYKPIEKQKSDKIQITFPRRAVPERGFWLIADALPPIMEKYPNVIFDFVGFAYGDKIISMIEKLVAEFPNRINHYVVEPYDMPSIYQKSDISLIPTIYGEGTSLSCLEAMACGNVVISTNIGGLPNLIIDGYNGLLINPNGVELMRALDKVLDDKELQKTLSQNAINVSTVFDKKIWINRWNEIIKSVKE